MCFTRVPFGWCDKHWQCEPRDGSGHSQASAGVLGQSISVTNSHLCLVSAAEVSWGLLQISHVSQGVGVWCAHQHEALFRGWMGRSRCSPGVDSTWTHSFCPWRDFLSINRKNEERMNRDVLYLKIVGHPLVLTCSFSHSATATTPRTAMSAT